MRLIAYSTAKQSRKTATAPMANKKFDLAPLVKWLLRPHTSEINQPKPAKTRNSKSTSRHIYYMLNSNHQPNCQKSKPHFNKQSTPNRQSLSPVDCIDMSQIQKEKMLSRETQEHPCLAEGNSNNPDSPVKTLLRDSEKTSPKQSSFYLEME